MTILNTMRSIMSHPLNEGRKASAFLNYVRWQLGSRLLPGEIAFPWVNDSTLLVQPGEHAATGNIYCGLLEFREMAYVLHATTREDIFVDIGANVGTYTILACAVQGAKGCAFEPIPRTFRQLERNIMFNGLNAMVSCHNVGIGECDTVLRFTTDEKSMNHVRLESDPERETVEVPVRTLKSQMEGIAPTFIKIDVEGYELPVLRGAAELLRMPCLHSILIEVNGNGKRYGHDDFEVIQAIEEFGFRAYSYDPFTRELTEAPDRVMASRNAIFIRDYDFIAKRVKSAAPVAVHGAVI